MASKWSYKNQNSSYRGKFQWLFDQGKGYLVRVSWVFELSGFELTEWKWLESIVRVTEGISSHASSSQWGSTVFFTSLQHGSWTNKNTKVRDHSHLERGNYIFAVLILTQQTSGQSGTLTQLELTGGCIH